MGYVLSGLGFAYFIAGRYEDALPVGLKSLQESPAWMPAHRLVILCLVHLGRLDEARVAANRMLELAPKTTISAIRLQIPQKNEAYKERYINAMRVAGIPE